MEILVFKTSVDSPEWVRMLKPDLDQKAGKGKWNFALDDSDNILRVASNKISANETIQLLKERGFACRELDY